MPTEAGHTSQHRLTPHRSAAPAQQHTLGDSLSLGVDRGQRAGDSQSKVSLVMELNIRSIKIAAAGATGERNEAVLVLPHIAALLMSPWQTNKGPWTAGTHLCLAGRAGRPSHWWRKMMEDSITCPSCKPVKHVLARFCSTLLIGE